MEKVLVIVGETASGKTSLSIKLAKLFNGEIINGDAYQVYRNLDIITDKIKESDKQGIAHHLLDIIDIDTSYSVSNHQENVRNAIKDITSRNKLPILVGGTGLYIKASLYDYVFEKENDNIDTSKYDSMSNEDLYELLKKVDNEATKSIHPNNRRRVIRALSIYDSTGKRKSDIIDSQNHKMLYDALFIGLTDNKDIINKKIDDRIDYMWEHGLVEEIEPLSITSTASKAIGFNEVKSYLAGTLSKQEAIQAMKIHTHQYAKRQRTWIRNQFDVNYFNSNYNIDDIKDLIDSWLNKKAS